MISKDELIEFEKKIANMFEERKIPYPIHLSGGNEDQLIEIFGKVKKGDYIFSTHRSHYHYLLAGGKPEKLEKMICDGKSMRIMDKELNFFASSIVTGCCGIAVGVALALRKKLSKQQAYVFVGDGAEDEGHFYEAVRYVDGWQLPCTFIIEDNGFSVNTPKSARYNTSEINWPACVKRYHYTRTLPHVGIGKYVTF